jgi:hypothetical protein
MWTNCENNRERRVGHTEQQSHPGDGGHAGIFSHTGESDEESSSFEEAYWAGAGQGRAWQGMAGHGRHSEEFSLHFCLFSDMFPSFSTLCFLSTDGTARLWKRGVVYESLHQSQ